MSVLAWNATNQPRTEGDRLALEFDVVSALLASVALDSLGPVPEPSGPVVTESESTVWYGEDGVARVVARRARTVLTARERVAKEVGEVVAAAWLQYLDFTVEDEEDEGCIELGVDLLPCDEHPGSFADAFRECLGALPIDGIDGARRLLSAFARMVLVETPCVDLPMDLCIEVARGTFGRTGFLARRRPKPAPPTRR